MEKLTALKLAQKIKNASITSKSATEFSYSKAKENKYNAFTGLNENAIKQAKKQDLKVIFLTGYKKTNQNVDIEINVPSETTCEIQEMHIAIGHIICEIIEENL